MAWEADAQGSISKALRSGDLDEFRKLLKQYPGNVRLEDGKDTWLSDASKKGRLPFVKLLVEDFGIDVNEPNTAYPEGAIVQAASRGHLEVVRWLLDHLSRDRTQQVRRGISRLSAGCSITERRSITRGKETAHRL